MAAFSSTSTIPTIWISVSSTRHADQITLLDGQGKVIVGTHEQLPGNSLVYRQMWDAPQPQHRGPLGWSLHSQ